jgi:hypothetical protein
MSYRDDNIEKRSTTFRTSMDIGMGLFYVAIGVILLYWKTYGNKEIPAIAAYIIGAMLVIGGGFRFYRGMKVILPKKKDE